MRQLCHVCRKEIEGLPGHLAYGVKQGRPFCLVLCEECRSVLTDEQVEEMERNQAFKTISEELGILGQ